MYKENINDLNLYIIVVMLCCFARFGYYTDEYRYKKKTMDNQYEKSKTTITFKEIYNVERKR